MWSNEFSLAWDWSIVVNAYLVLWYDAYSTESYQAIYRRAFDRWVAVILNTR